MSARVIGVNDAAKIIGVCPQRVRALIKAGRLKAQRVGRDWLFITSQVESFAAIERKAGRPVEGVK